ncbi:ABC-2 family transporter protein [Actinoplanes bogorensis]|uniref:ABC-2 family transporter protein n=1 Tax=Paractinoplanes bogorensis TaxID=1610840 RepID=A0ABS5Z4S3_9ACTN|nr:ABC-2 family transporter protein [Actinoplanes bogorensis]MBU2670694.1 ABC-2 family transporter protein [Actinoplanes bogorensis]
MAEFRAYAALLGGRLRSATAYRASFAVEIITNAGGTAIDVSTVFVLFTATRLLGGFTLGEALMMTGLTAAGFALADLTVGNIDQLKTYVRLGTLDAVLVRPLAVLPQLVIADLPLRKLLRSGVGLAVLIVAVASNDIVWTPARVALLVTAPLSGAVFFGSIFVLSASLAFWWVESGEVGSAFTYGGRDFTSYPISVYGGWFRAVFAYGLGFAFVSYHPALTLLGRADPLGLPAWSGYVSPLVALAAAGLAGVVWRIGVRRYRSTGS